MYHFQWYTYWYNRGTYSKSFDNGGRSIQAHGASDGREPMPAADGRVHQVSGLTGCLGGRE